MKTRRRLRYGMISLHGPGWAVTDDLGDPLPGRWATEAEADERGLFGAYLLSGRDVVEVIGPSS